MSKLLLFPLYLPILLIFSPSLQDNDRTALQSAAQAFSTWSAIGSGVGLGLGLLLAFRVRSARQRMFTAL